MGRLQVEGASTPCTAGEEKAIDVLTVDAYGHATAQDGSAQITVTIASGAHIFPGKSGQERVAANHEADDVSCSMHSSTHNSMNNMLLQSVAFHSCHKPTGVSFTVYPLAAPPPPHCSFSSGLQD